MKCPFCGNEVDNLEEHLRDWHFLKIHDYYEMKPLKSEDQKCCKCGQYRFPLTYIEPGGYFLPHWNCIWKYEKDQYIKSIKSTILDYYGRVGSDRFLQMFLISDVYFSSTPSHSYEEFKNVLKKLQKPDRNRIWFLDWLPGFHKTLSLDNLTGIKAIPIDQYYWVKSDSDKIVINNITVKYANIVPYDYRHHSRYNIFNTSPNVRLVRRLKLSGGECIRFNTNKNKSYTIFEMEKDGNQISPNDLSELDLLVVKMLLLRNKTFMKLILSALEELVNNARVLSDSIFLKNTITLDKGSDIHLSWTPDNIKENFINISIL